ncbi:YkgJ family cysteine cluster protein [Candidatus Woesearchaeota archaeon]|nr:YkgJ family cysteine cluster protein [Candidatus Woesearchaeota archaeon]
MKIPIEPIQITKQSKANEVEVLATCDPHGCGKFAHCCKYESAILNEDEIPKIANFLNISAEECKQKYLEKCERFNTEVWRARMEKTDVQPRGPCVFLHNNLCSIHPVKPLFCRIGSCNAFGERFLQWYWLNHCVQKEDAESIRQWAHYLRAHMAIPGGSLEEIIPNKERLQRMLTCEDV